MIPKTTFYCFKDKNVVYIPSISITYGINNTFKFLSFLQTKKKRSFKTVIYFEENNTKLN